MPRARASFHVAAAAVILCPDASQRRHVTVIVSPFFERPMTSRPIPPVNATFPAVRVIAGSWTAGGAQSPSYCG